MNKKENQKVINLNDKKIQKKIQNEVDPKCHDELNLFIEKFQNDTLTGK